ncbi:two-component system sensor histidine kinase MtrB [Arthrobacter pigmenti]|uniref:Sensor histidine kinase MtrB n=1 Tax=Arthrobacter pigmenti TaxID=271432 RepID=A0A846RI43_9MICC|nr:two-component system sensor histidine kinase MtrB [Arthrobacter pigmenti]
MTSTLVLTAVALVAVGAFLSSQIANGLYQERLDQFKAEASEGLSEVKQIFAQTSVTGQEDTGQLVRDTLPSLEGGGADAPRQFILADVPEQQTSDFIISPFGSNDLTESAAIPDQLIQAVRTGDAQYWSPTSLPTSASGTELNVPGIAFGTKVTLPPEQTEYALYLLYDLSSMQATLDYIHGVIWIGGTLLLLTIGAIVWLVTRSLVGPVSHAALVSEKLAAGQLQERMETQGEDEVARLGASFNHMAASLQDQITQLAQLSQMQQRFVSDVSHELRTPLTTVRMAAEVLHEARRDFDPVNRRSAEILYNQVERFQALLADLLEISRFDAGAAVLDAEPTDIFQLVQHVIDGAQPLADSHKSEITVISSETKCVVDADPRRIDRILRNLVLNALEHGEGKPINIYIASNPDAVAVAVRDHGIGMSPLDAARVFDRFWRADPARARTTGGSGLGLSIATEDARLHGAWLQAWGSPGEGSCFRLTLPKRRDAVLKVSPLPLPPRQAALPPGPVEANQAAPDALPTLHGAVGGDRS